MELIGKQAASIDMVVVPDDGYGGNHIYQDSSEINVWFQLKDSEGHTSAIDTTGLIITVNISCAGCTGDTMVSAVCNTDIDSQNGYGTNVCSVDISTWIGSQSANRTVEFDCFFLRFEV